MILVRALDGKGALRTFARSYDNVPYHIEEWRSRHKGVKFLRGTIKADPAVIGTFFRSHFGKFLLEDGTTELDIWYIGSDDNDGMARVSFSGTLPTA